MHLPSRARVPLIWVALGAVLLATELTETLAPERQAARDGWWVLATTVGVLLELGVLYVALRLARRYTIGRGQPWRHVAPHTLLWLAYAATAYAVDAAWAVSHGLAMTSVPVWLLNSLLSVAVWDGVAHGIEYLRRWRESEADALRLRIELADVARRRAEAEFRALRAELNPRVMSDALDAISAMAPGDAAGAERALVELGDTMRAAISATPDVEWDDAEQADDAVNVETPAPPGRPRTFAAVLTLCFALLLAGGFAIALNAPLPSGAEPPVGGSLLQAFIVATTLTAILYVAVRMARESRRFRAHAVAALAFGVAIALTKVVVALVVGFPYLMPTPARLITTVPLGVFLYALLSGAAAAVEYARRYRGSAAKTLRLQADLADTARRRAQAQLRALKAELNPHFLGNAMAAAATLVHADVDGAQRIMSQLKTTLRGAVARLDTQEVTLREEIDALAPFLDLERARLGDRLEVAWSVDDEAMHVAVPHLILQPLVENAVKHGLAGVAGRARIVVAGRRAGDRLELSVLDNGAGIKPAKRSTGGGVGLANIRSRLEELYGSGASFELAPAPPPDAGTIARVSLPWRGS